MEEVHQDGGGSVIINEINKFYDTKLTDFGIIYPNIVEVGN